MTPPRPEPVARAELSTWKMVAGNEERIPVVIDNGIRKEWVGIGWIDIGPATEHDLATYPTVKD